MAAPIVTSVTPDTGPSTGGLTVIIVGRNFNGTTGVTFGTGHPATTVSVHTHTSTTGSRIECRTPAHTTGPVTVNVTTTVGTGAKDDAFTYFTPPRITSISPTAGSTLGGTTVIITGAHLAGAGEGGVSFGGVTARTVLIVSNTEVTCVIPAHDSAGVVLVNYFDEHGSSNEIPFTYKFETMLSAVFGGALGGITGVPVSAWRRTRFETTPIEGSEPPSGTPDAGPVTTSTDFGSPGAWHMVADEITTYWILAVFNTVRYWSLYPATGTGEGGGGGGTVDKIEAGGGISISPSTGLGTVTVTNAGVKQLVAGENISLTPSTGKGDVTVTSTGSGSPTGDAGGDLSGTYPDPGVGKVPPSALVAGTHVSIATTSGKAKISASEPTKVTMGGDVTGTSTASVVAKVPHTAVVAGTNVTVTNTSGKAKITASVQTTSKVTMGGDVTGTSTASTVAKIHGHTVVSTAPTSNQGLLWTATNSEWVPTTVTAAIVGAIATSARGAATGVAELNSSRHVPATELGATAATGKVLTATGGTTAHWATPPGAQTFIGQGSFFTPAFWYPVYAVPQVGTFNPTRLAIYFQPFVLNETVTFTAIGFQVATGLPTSVVRLALYATKDTANAPRPGARTATFGTVATTSASATGVLISITTRQLLIGNVYWLAFCRQGSGTGTLAVMAGESGGAGNGLLGSSVPGGPVVSSFKTTASTYTTTLPTTAPTTVAQTGNVPIVQMKVA